MLAARYRKYVQSFLLIVPMTGIVTTLNTFVAKGSKAILTAPTLHRWGISILVAYPCILFMAPLAMKITNRLVKPD